MSTDVQEWTVVSMLEWGTDYFKKRNIPDPRLSIEWLLAEVLQVKRLDLYLKFDRPLTHAELDDLRPLVKRRAAHEPLQYIVGYSDFMNARVSVTPDVLIPRIETEQLVEIILDRHPAGSPLSVLDIGTGSGCIPIALKIERSEWSISALDISAAALDTARKNAAANEADISFLKGDITQWRNLSLGHNFDIIVSNPPYILPDEKDTLESQVTDHEPALALFCQSIEQMYGNVIDCAAAHLGDQGQLYLEIHERYSDTILSLFEPEKWSASLHEDYENKPRFITAAKQFSG
ncbi:MAG: peptide chain release factor N(5)-glutamine methyltransferase [Balneolaceae bacterium]|nr:peptide chain release factor N(5)-glutamine methyltransferase [Balneolaceae bacterium]